MKRNILITILVLLVPFLGGGLIGYSVGHTSSGNGIASAQPASGEVPPSGAQTGRADSA